MIIKTANRQDKGKIRAYLMEVQNDFDPPLLNRIGKKSSVKTVDAYINKIFRFGSVLYFDQRQEIGGIVVIYANDKINKNAYIPLLSVKRKFSGQGIAALLIKHCLALAEKKEMKDVIVKTWKTNKPAIHLYDKMGFAVMESIEDIVFVKKL